RPGARQSDLGGEDLELSTPPHPGSFLAHRGRIIELKVHRCLWSGDYSENSPLAIEECGRENVLRTEIDVQLLRDGEFVVFHDDRLDRVTDARGLVRETSAADATRARFKDGSHPLLKRRLTTTAEYLRDRFGGIMRLVPGPSEAHLRLAMFERMLDDGIANVAHIFHGLGIKVDVWTLDADTPRWRERFARLVDA